MANNPQIKFSKVATYDSITSPVVVGTIYYVTNTGMFYIATSTSKNDLLRFGGNINDSNWSDNKLSLYNDNGTKSEINLKGVVYEDDLDKYDQFINSSNIKHESYDAALESINSTIAGLSSATNFRGVKTTIPSTAYKGLEYGDIIIVDNKEYIYNADPTEDGYSYSVDHWVELGDTSDEIRRLTELENELENWKTNIDPLHSWVEW